MTKAVQLRSGGAGGAVYGRAARRNEERKEADNLYQMSV